MPRRPILLLLLIILLAPRAAYARSTLYVDQAAPPDGDGLTWDTAFVDLQDALDAASGGTITQIWVAAGTYRPDRGSRDRTATFSLREGLAVYGGFAGGETELDQRDPDTHLTILCGDLLGDDGPDFVHSGDNSYHVVTASGVDSTAVIDGFTIRGGNAASLGGVNSTGGGIIALEGSPQIVNCRFYHNRATFGGALHFKCASPSIRDCTFEDNLGSFFAGAVYSATDCTFALINCVFVENSTLNQGGALANSLGCDITLINCGFYGNYAINYGGGGILNSSGNLTAVNCVFSGNRSNGSQHGGGALRNEQGSATLINCTLHDNSAAVGGGIYNFLGSETSLENCILWANTDDSGQAEQAQIAADGGIPLLRHCCVQNWTGTLGGVANFGHDPSFVDPDGPDDLPGTPDDNLRLSDCASPCTNTGDNDALPPDVFDLDNDDDLVEPLPVDYSGQARVDDGRVDRGAYEVIGFECLCGDFDFDGDVDFVDFIVFATCLAGPEVPVPPPSCSPAEFAQADCQGDNDVDLADFALFQTTFGGS